MGFLFKDFNPLGVGYLHGIDVEHDLAERPMVLFTLSHKRADACLDVLRAFSAALLDELMCHERFAVPCNIVEVLHLEDA